MPDTSLPVFLNVPCLFVIYSTAYLGLYRSQINLVILFQIDLLIPLVQQT